MARFGRSFIIPRRVYIQKKSGLLQNTFEGGTDGVAISSGNSGGSSGNAFNGVFVSGTGSEATYRATPTRPSPSTGTRVGQFTAGTGSAWAEAQWGTSFTSMVPNGVKNEHWGRAYIYPVALVSGTLYSCRISGGSTVASFGPSSSSTRNLAIRNQSGTIIAVMGIGLRLNEWTRLEWYFNIIDGIAELRQYNNANDLTPSETLRVTGASFGSTALSLVDIGAKNAGANLYIDDFVVSTGNWLGPNPSPTEIPFADAGPDQLGVSWESTVNLSGSNSTGTGLTYKWEQVYGPAVTLNNPTTATPNFVADDE